MITLRVVASRRLDSRQGAAALVGAAVDGSLFGCLGSFDVLPAGDSLVERREDEVVPLDPGCPQDEALDLLAAWPPWRVLDAASVEVGSRTLVVGTGSLCAAIVDLLRGRGALTAHHETLQSRPRAAWDVVILADGPVGLLADAMKACRTRGTVVLAGTYGEPLDLDLYVDVHRRGLRIACVAPYESTPLARSEWARTAPALRRLLRRRPGART
jgi:hypothetical protein